MLSILLMLSIFSMPDVEISNTVTPLTMLENYVVAQRLYGPDHPQMRKRRKDIESAINSDFQFDKRQVQLRFEELASDRKILLRSKGLTHPATLENAIRLSLVSRLLSGETAAAVCRHIFDTKNRK